MVKLTDSLKEFLWGKKLQRNNSLIDVWTCGIIHRRNSGRIYRVDEK